MMIRRFRGLTRPAASMAASCVLAAGLTGIFTEPVLAQQQATAEAPQQQQPASTPAASAPATEKFLSLAEIERRATATGIRVTEIEVKDRLVEVEGRDAQNREVELKMDRRSGEILSRKIED
jgi:uncharacterized membrane protein YkoI